MNKDLKGIILFAGLFLFICYILFVLLFFVQVLSFTPICSNNDEKEVCLSIALIAIFTTKIFQVIGLAGMSFFGIIKTHNPFIKKIFNSWIVPCTILLLCILIDFCIKFITRDYFDKSYEIFYSLTGNFIVIFIISILYQVIKLIKNKINQEKPWSARRWNSWQLL